MVIKDDNLIELIKVCFFYVQIYIYYKYEMNISTLLDKEYICIFICTGVNLFC